MRGRWIQRLCANFDIFKANGEVGDHTGMQHILKVLSEQVPHHIQSPSQPLGPFILTMGKTFPDILQCVHHDDVAVGHVVDINPCRALPEEYLSIHLHQHKLVPPGAISDSIIFPDIS